eukprot:1142754-Pelagomonas_calceolata.AAC.2
MLLRVFRESNPMQAPRKQGPLLKRLLRDGHLYSTSRQGRQQSGRDAQPNFKACTAACKGKGCALLNLADQHKSLVIPVIGHKVLACKEWLSKPNMATLRRSSKERLDLKVKETCMEEWQALYIIVRLPTRKRASLAL